MTSPQMYSGGFNVSSALSGFAIGAVVTVMAFVAIDPKGAASQTTLANGSTPGATTLTLGNDGSGGSVSVPQVGQTTQLANGTQVTRLSSGQLRVTDTSGRSRVVTIAGSAGTAATTVGGSGGSSTSTTVGGSAGTSSTTVGGSAGTSSTTVGGSAGSAGSNGSSSSSSSSGSNGGASGSGTSTAPGGGTTGCSGGATDTGVTSTSIKLGATVAETGIATAFLGDARQGIEAYKTRINSKGGICGRMLNIKYVDDGWKPDVGQQDLLNLINEDKVFALAVSPSSEGVNAASSAGVFDNAGVPVVGTDGLDASQYKDPYIWPVASATVTLMHVMMANAWANKAHNPAIVFDSQYRFGTEGANAFEKAYERLSGGQQIPGAGSSSCAATHRFCPVSAATGQYTNEVSIINNACKASGSTPACDYLVLLLEPETAQQWMATPGAPTAASFPVGGIGAAQPLFTRSFGTNCGDRCNGLQVWTGYNPPIEQYANTPDIKTYLNDLNAQSSSVDPNNQFTEGSYLGMRLLADAIAKVGANLTRAGLKSALDSMSLTTGLAAAPESWAAGSHWAVGGAQGFTMQSSNGFSGWRSTTPYTKDPWLGQDFG